MPRPCRKRMIREEPAVTFFKPAGMPMLNLRIITLTLDEWEALRLADAEKMYQEQASLCMGISRPTFSRLIESARCKVARALTQGAALEIEGGPVMQQPRACCRRKDHGKRQRVVESQDSRRTKMKKRIAITAQGTALSEALDPRFGRAAGFLVYDTEDKTTTYISNEQNLNAVQGAGIQAARHVVNQKVDTVITGNIGPKAFRFLNAADVEVYLAENMSVQEAITMYEKGELPLQDNANVEGHW